MKKKKFVLIIIVSLILILGIIAGFFISNKISNKYSDCVTRQEWITLLGEHTGATDYSEETPYFEDVNDSDDAFSYIQAAVEWGYIQKDNKFNGDKYASGKFIASSAIKSIGNPKIQLYLGTDDELSERDYINLALDLSLIEKDMLKKGLSLEEAKAVLDKLDDIYFDEFWQQDVDEYEYQEDVISLEKDTIVEYNKNTETVKGALDVKEGDIISFYDDGFVIVRKVKTQHEDGIFELEMPAMEEAFKELRQSGTAELTFQNIVNYYGDENLHTAMDDGNDKLSTVMVSHSIEGEVESKGFKIEAKVEKDDDEKNKLKIIVTSNDTDDSIEIPIGQDVSDEFENFNTTLNVSKILVGSQLDYSAKDGVKYADVAIDIETESSMILDSVDDVSERIMLFETPAPIGSGLVGVDVQIYLVVSMSGNISLEAELPYQMDVYYEKDKGIKCKKNDFEIKDPKIKASAEMKERVSFAPILVVGGFAPIIDSEFGASSKTEASITVHDNGQICSDVAASFPYFDIIVGQEDIKFKDKISLIAELEINKEWEFEIDEMMKAFQIHFECLPDGAVQYVDKCTYGKESSEEIEQEEVVETVDDEILNQMLSGDFSYFAGTYVAREEENIGYGGGEPIENLILNNDGSIEGGGDTYINKKPKAVSKNEDGSYLCIITYEDEVIENRYTIYPVGVAEDRLSDNSLYVDNIYIRVFKCDGGVSDIVYYKADEKVTADSADEPNPSMFPNTYTTKDSSMPIFEIDYPDSWHIESEELGPDYEWDTISSSNGIDIQFYSSTIGFEQYYGGNYEMCCATATKVADSSFVPGTSNGTDYSSLGKFVVAKINVYEIDDGLTGETYEVDGPTYYAVVPESCLGEQSFKGMGYWGANSWNYGRSVVVIATAPEGNFTPEQETEVIQILSSFRLQ